MDVLNVDSTSLSDEEIENDDGIQRLIQGLNISDLSQSGAEFAVQVNEDAALETQSSYDSAAVFPHLNLNCLGPEDDGSENEAFNNDQPFTYLATKMTDIVANGKVKKRIISEGYGEVVPENALVWFHHNSYYENKDEPFDSSYLRGRMTMLRLNSGRCIVGLDIGLSTMKRGEKAELLIHPDFAYGKLGVMPRIPANAHILIIVEMKKFVDNALAVKMGELTDEELKSTPFEEIYKGALSSLYNGNSEFSSKKYTVAVKFYRNGLRILENCDMKSDEDDAKNEALRLKLYTNMGVSYNKMNHPKQAIVASQSALRIQPKGAKILYQLGLAHLNLGGFDEAKKFAFLARKYAPTNADVSTLLQSIEKKLERYNSSAVSFAKNAFRFAENNPEKVSSKNVSAEKENKIGSYTPMKENDVKSPQGRYSSGVKIVEINEEESLDLHRGEKEKIEKNMLPPETSSDRVSETESQEQRDLQTEFEQETVAYIMEFCDDPKERQLQLPFGLTYEEEMFFKTQAKLYNLRWEERQHEGRTGVFLLK